MIDFPPELIEAAEQVFAVTEPFSRDVIERHVALDFTRGAEWRVAHAEEAILAEVVGRVPHLRRKIYIWWRDGKGIAM